MFRAVLLPILSLCFVQFSLIASQETLEVSISVLPGAPLYHGESPHWDIKSQNLYAVDLSRGGLWRYDYNEQKSYACKVENEDYAGFIIPIEGRKNKFAVGCRRKVVIVDWDGFSSVAKVEETLFTVQDGMENIRFNDGKCDSRGRFYGGTVDISADCSVEHVGVLLMYDPYEVDVLGTDIGISNGLCWNEKLQKMYYIDTCDQEVKQYDYNVNSGEISNQQVLYQMHADNESDLVFPDGMTIDSVGNLYVALYNGNGIYKIDPFGNLLGKIEMPTKHITSVAFGGPYLDILYVTTSAIGDSSEFAGFTYQITGLGVTGLPMHNFRTNKQKCLSQFY